MRSRQSTNVACSKFSSFSAFSGSALSFLLASIIASYMAEDNQDVQYLLSWVKDAQSGLSAHLQYHIGNNTPQVSQLAQAYRQLKSELGY
jgi:hypothetical protein